MEQPDILKRITQLKYDIAAIQLQGYAVSSAGGVAGVMLANKRGKSFWGKAGYFIAGCFIANLPVTLINSARLKNKLAELETLQAQLPQPAPEK